MDNISRRSAIGHLAAAVLASTTIASAAKAGASPGRTLPGSMTLDEFLTMDEFVTTDGPDGTEGLLDRLDCHSFSQCHERMRAENGTWIPELVPVFAKLDAMRASAKTRSTRS